MALYEDSIFCVYKALILLWECIVYVCLNVYLCVYASVCVCVTEREGKGSSHIPELI